MKKAEGSKSWRERTQEVKAKIARARARKRAA